MKAVSIIFACYHLTTFLYHMHTELIALLGMIHRVDGLS